MKPKIEIQSEPIFHFITVGGVFCKKNHDYWNHDIDKIYKGWDFKIFKTSSNACAECIEAEKKYKHPPRKSVIL